VAIRAGGLGRLTSIVSPSPSYERLLFSGAEPPKLTGNFVGEASSILFWHTGGQVGVLA